MIACYDLARNPPTYDVVAFLATLESKRLAARESFVELKIAPGPAEGFRKDGLWPRSTAERQLLRDNVVVPMCRLLPCVRSVEVLNTRKGYTGLPGANERWISLPAIVQAYREGIRPLRYPGKAINDRYITFTLREAEHHPLRNSKLHEWIVAAQTIRRSGISVLVIRDTAKAYAEPIECPTDQNAALDLYTRARWYASAQLNVGISNGPMWLAMFMDTPTLMLRPVTDEAGACYDWRFYQKHGVQRYEQLPNMPAYQRLAWVDDTAENIVKEVMETLECAAV